MDREIRVMGFIHGTTEEKDVGWVGVKMRMINCQKLVVGGWPSVVQW